jgi:hypothetical protein
MDRFVSTIAVRPHFFVAGKTPLSKVITSSVSMMTACLIQILTTSLGAIYFARILLDISNAFFVNFSVSYLSEAAPGNPFGIILANPISGEPSRPSINGGSTSDLFVLPVSCD